MRAYSRNREQLPSHSNHIKFVIKLGPHESRKPPKLHRQIKRFDSKSCAFVSRIKRIIDGFCNMKPCSVPIQRLANCAPPLSYYY